MLDILNILLYIALSSIDVFLIHKFLSSIYEKEIKLLNLYSCITIMILTVISEMFRIYDIYYYILTSITFIVYSFQFLDKPSIHKNIVLFIIAKFLLEIIFIKIFETLLYIDIGNFDYYYEVAYIDYMIFIIDRYTEYIFITIYLSSKDGSSSINSIRSLKNLLFVFVIILFLNTVYRNKAVFEHLGDMLKVFVFIIFLMVCILFVLSKYEIQQERIEKENALMKQRISMTEEYIEKMERKDKDLRVLKHNMKNQLLTISSLVKESNTDALEYIGDIVGKFDALNEIVYTGHPHIDSILHHKLLLAKEYDIEIKEYYEGIDIGDVDLYDMTDLLCNALDNAIEGALKVDKHREICVRIFNQGAYLVINIGNCICEGANIDFNKTSKSYEKGFHGIGVGHIQRIAKKYNGCADYEVEGNFVTLNIILLVKH